VTFMEVKHYVVVWYNNDGGDGMMKMVVAPGNTVAMEVRRCVVKMMKG